MASVFELPDERTKVFATIDPGALPFGWRLYMQWENCATPRLQNRERSKRAKDATFAIGLKKKLKTIYSESTSLSRSLPLAVL